jgi:midasin
MQTGGLLLIDEISLANDSVLERLNSVFEADRMLVLSEKSSTEAVKIVARNGFNMVATMNPSGDFGKKELSPALRNRMTEIWVESYF